MHIPDHEIFRAAVAELERENRELRTKVKRRDIVIGTLKRERLEVKGVGQAPRSLVEAYVDQRLFQ